MNHAGSPLATHFRAWLSGPSDSPVSGTYGYITWSNGEPTGCKIGDNRFAVGNTNFFSDHIEIAEESSGDRVAFIDFHSADGVDYNARIIREAGTNGPFSFTNLGTGAVSLIADNFQFWNFGNQRFVVAADGTMYNPKTYLSNTGGREVRVQSTGEFTSIASNAALKKNIEPIYDSVVEKIYDFRVVNFQFRHLEKGQPSWSHYGLVAEDVEKIDPRFCSYDFHDTKYEDYEVKVPVKYKDENGKTKRKLITEKRRKAVIVPLEKPQVCSVEYSRLSVLCIAALQKQKVEIDDLKARLEALEKKK